MYPVLFQLFSFRLHTYGLLMGLAFILAMHLSLRRSTTLGISEHFVNEALFLALLGGIVGARLLFVLVDGPLFYLRHPLEVFKVWKGGLVYFGGFIAAFAAISWHAKRHGENVLAIYDLFAPALALGHAIGRIGCFMAGCCYGKLCDLPWAVEFKHPEGVGLKNVPLHPTQVYSSLFLLGLYFLLLLMRRRQRFHGAVALTYLTVYPIGRSLIEMLRNDFRGGFWGLSTAQWISIPIALTAATFFVRLAKRRAKPLTT